MIIEVICVDALDTLLFCSSAFTSTLCLHISLARTELHHRNVMKNGEKITVKTMEKYKPPSLLNRKLKFKLNLL